MARVQSTKGRTSRPLLEARQTLFDTIVEDRAKAQSVIEHQARCLIDFNSRFDAINADHAKAQELLGEPVGSITELAERFLILSRDRADEQLVMDNQFDQIQKMHAKVTEQKQALVAAKAACRNKGRCFVIPKEPKPQRSVGERFARELARIPRNLTAHIFAASSPTTKKNCAKRRLKKITQSG